MKQSFNYLFWGSFFGLFFFLYETNLILTKQYPLYLPLFTFLLIAQLSMEFGLLMLIGSWIKEKGSKKAISFFIAASSFLFLFHFIDVILLRTMSMSLKETLIQVLEEDVASFWELLKASNIPALAWIIIALCLSAVPPLTLFYYRFTEKIINRRPFIASKQTALTSLFLLASALLLWDYTASYYIKADAYYVLTKHLGWNKTFYRAKKTFIPSTKELLGPHDNEAKLASLKTKKKPNIFFFVVESLREDFINDQIAPNLTTFKQDYISFPKAVSSANGTQISWFSLFFSDYPYLWAEYRKSKLWGSPAIKKLKKMGYKTHLFSSAALQYYHMDKLLFGKDHELIDHYYALDHTYPAKACDSDRETLKLCEQHLDKNYGNLYIFFWDATHFDYSWPSDFKVKFTPTASEKDYFQPIQNEPNLQLIKNNYKNAISYVDHLFGSFQQMLIDKKLWDNSIIVFCSDHGEEFLEHGMLFHASHLVKEQTHIPLYMKFPSDHPVLPLDPICSHVDILPSIFQYITKNYKSDCFRGQTIFKPRKWPFALCSRFNGGKVPNELFLTDGTVKLIGLFSKKNEVMDSTGVEVIQFSDWEDKPFTKITPSHFHTFTKGLSALFSKDPFQEKEALTR
jgi:glucan phosphoethanolaminetransferase (alkaline phosphatase superfamily)